MQGVLALPVHLLGYMLQIYAYDGLHEGGVAISEVCKAFRPASAGINVDRRRPSCMSAEETTAHSLTRREEERPVLQNKSVPGHSPVPSLSGQACYVSCQLQGCCLQPSPPQAC